MKPWRSLLILLCMLTAFPATARSEATATPFMIAADHPLAAEAGRKIFLQGGNIMDAAVAVSLALAVVKPQSTGLGGGGFLLFHDAKKKRARAFDFRERAPQSATPAMYLRNGRPTVNSYRGVRAAAIPGLVAGLMDLQRRYGRLSRETVLAPAIVLARDGFPVYPTLREALRQQEKEIRADPPFARVFLPGGRLPRNGQILKQPELARTLRAIATDGKKVFYRGWIAQAIVSLMKAKGGEITLKDLKRYRMKTRSPVTGTYHGRTIVSMPPPSSGGVHLIQMLNMLESDDLSTLDPQGADYVHLLAEVMRRAYHDRARYLGDPDFVSVPMKKLTSKKRARRQRATVDPHRATPKDNRLTPGGDGPGTTNFCVVDEQRNAIVSTQSINTSFGALVMVPNTGILLNNTMDDFSVAPGVPNRYGLIGSNANAIAPGKTPLSSMTPTLVFQGHQLELVLGAPGGAHIITGVLQTILNVYDFGEPIARAVAAPRLHHQYVPNEILLEKGRYPTATQRRLHHSEHRVKQGANRSRVTAIGVKDGSLIGVSDPRGKNTVRGEPVEP